MTGALLLLKIYFCIENVATSHSINVFPFFLITLLKAHLVNHCDRVKMKMIYFTIIVSVTCFTINAT